MLKYSLTNNKVFEIIGLISDNEEIYYEGISTVDMVSNNTIIFIKKIDIEQEKIIQSTNNCLIITEDTRRFPFITYPVSNSRYAMAKVLKYINDNNPYEVNGSISNAVISPGARIGDNVIVEDFVYIDSDVTIGNGVCIKQGVRIFKNTIIGDNCIIRENSVIGGQGFGVEKDEYGNNFKIPHLGGVHIFDNVEIGALNTIAAGTINPTVIESYVKTDDHVHIAHNCHIGSNVNVTAGVVLSGSVKVGDNSYIGPNSTIKNSLKIEKNSFIGMGTVITKDIDKENEVYAGVPGKRLDELIRCNKAIQFLKENINQFKNKKSD